MRRVSLWTVWTLLSLATVCSAAHEPLGWAQITPSDLSSDWAHLVEPSPIQDNDRVEDLLEISPIYRTLQEMENHQLQSQELSRRPWSDSYWPLNMGITGNRFADPKFPSSKKWAKNFRYIKHHPASELLAKDQGENLSPSEKYDYLVGDDDYTLTYESWNVVKAAQRKIESWEGICDGWATASIFYDETIHNVTVSGVGDRVVKFYPSDIDGLSSLLWAKGRYPSSRIGTKCMIKKPPKDSAGRTIAPECLDSNPATWHMAVVNQLGRAKRPLIIDATYDYEIWNYPVWKYDYSYFNPQTLQSSVKLAEALVPYGQFANDRFTKYRSPDVRYVVGISMHVTYMKESFPNHFQGSHATAKTVQYVYDLELDEQMRIIGGEWYRDLHPDFIWAPKVGARAVSMEDPMLVNPRQWTGAQPMPDAWAASAKVASKLLQPLATVVDQLVRLSHESR